MKKAKSRLQVQPVANDIAAATTLQRKIQTNGRVKHWKTLAIGLLFLVSLCVLLFFIDPESIQNWLIPNSYLLFFFLLFGSIFFIVSFVALNSFIGLWAALLTCIFAFFRIQQVVFTGAIWTFFVIGTLPLGFWVIKQKLFK